MCRINELDNYKRTPVKLLISIFLIVATLISDIAMKIVTSSCYIDGILHIRIFNFIVVGFTVFILLTAETRGRKK